MSFTLWFTGLSGAGKTTLSRRVHHEILRRCCKAELLDGDIVRSNISQELGFSRADRDINLRRIGFISHLLNRNGIISVVAAIAPYADSRLRNRAFIANYIEVYCSCPLHVAEERDVKGLYARARRGEIQNFTGISDPYEVPESPEIVLPTQELCVEESERRILDCLIGRDLIPPEPSISLEVVKQHVSEYHGVLQKFGCLP